MRWYVTAVLLGLALPGGVARAQDASQIDCSTAQTQADLNACAKMDFDEADSNLNDAFKAAVARMQALDQALPKEQQGAEAGLRDAQRTWITFRDQACASEGWTVHGGSLESVVVLECKARLSSTRADDLWSLSETEGG
jgi:uncharacterized protein YecT (DUF1311 family)